MVKAAVGEKGQGETVIDMEGGDGNNFVHEGHDGECEDGQVGGGGGGVYGHGGGGRHGYNGEAETMMMKTMMWMVRKMTRDAEVSTHMGFYPARVRSGEVPCVQCFKKYWNATSRGFKCGAISVYTKRIYKKVTIS